MLGRCARLALLVSIIATLQARAQKDLSSIRISIDLDNVPLREAIAKISAKSGVPFSYNPRKIPVEKKITYSANDKPMAKVLDDITALCDLKFLQVENQLILQPEKKTQKPREEIPITLSGYVKDQQSGEALIGATVYVDSLKIGTTTNGFGFYSLTMPKGTHRIVYSFIGFRPSQRTITLNGSLRTDLAMEEQAPLLQEVVITSRMYDIVGDIQVSKMNIRPTAVEQRPAYLGEMDVLKSLESVPGVKMHSDGSNFYSVRGGNRDQNLVIIDDAPIYNPSHLLGVFSTIIPDAVNDITLFKGDMPASYGGRLSSILDVRTKKGNDQHVSGWGNFGLISTKVGIEGPFKKGASSYLVSARISRLKWIMQRLDSNIKDFSFGDLTAKVNVKLNASNRMFGSFYTGGDNYFNANSGISWNNSALTLRWNHIFSDRIFLNTTLAGSNYDYFLYTDVANDTKWNSHISNITFKTDFSYFITSESELTFGTALNEYGFNPGNLQSKAALPELPYLSVRNSSELVLYGNHEVKLNDQLGLSYGLRLSSWANHGDAFEYTLNSNHEVVDTLYFPTGQPYKRYTRLEPRLSLNYELDRDASLKLSYARNVQNIHLISNSVSPFTSLEVWLPSSINIKPQLANQISLGYFRNVYQRSVTLSGELYYKKLYNQIDYTAHAETLLNPALEKELRFGMGTAYGFELITRKDEGRWRGWAGYSYSRSKRKFNDINSGLTFNSFYDRPHQVNLMISYDLTRRWNVGMNWIYSTGAPYSAPISFYQFNGEEIPVYGQKNNARLPDYHRMDLSATYQLNKNAEKKYKHELAFSVFNVYGRKNILFVNFNKTETSEGKYGIPANLLDQQRLTTQYYLFNFTPSIAYRFKFN